MPVPSMLTPSPIERDPLLFEQGREQILGAVLVEVAQRLAVVQDAQTEAQSFDQEARDAAMLEDRRESDPGVGGVLDGLEERVGMSIGDFFAPAPEVQHIDAGGNISDTDPTLSDPDDPGTELVDYICGYQNRVKSNIRDLYDDDASAEASAWGVTWKKVRELLLEAEGTPIAELVKHVDGIARRVFGNTYQPMDEDRGPLARKDPCARAFYRVMQPHLSRSNQRAAQDEWSGFRDWTQGSEG